MAQHSGNKKLSGYIRLPPNDKTTIMCEFITKSFRDMDLNWELEQNTSCLNISDIFQFLVKPRQNLMPCD